MQAPAEPFELIQELGRGGFAVTYRARVLDDELREEFGASEVALKIPTSRQKERVLRRELELNAGLHMRLKGLKSANVVRYLGFEVFRGQLVMVMEFVEQGSLRERLGRIGRQKPLPVAEAVAIAEGVLSGLGAIHREHVFHRDIKPENILLRGRTPKIADLGIARLLDEEQVAVTQAGTLPYMSPEILGAQGASFTSDLWSLAVTLYEMLSGRLPFGDESTPIAVFVAQICTAELRPVHEVAPEVPRELSQILSRALRKDPAERYASADEMAAALANFREGQGAGAVEREAAAIRELMADPSRVAEAEKRAAALVARYPKDSRAFQCQGELQNRCQRYQEAIAAFGKAVELAPQSGLLHWNLALACNGAGQRQQAADALDKALALDLDPTLRRHATMLRRALKGA